MAIFQNECTNNVGWLIGNSMIVKSEKFQPKTMTGHGLRNLFDFCLLISILRLRLRQKLSV